MPSAAALAEPLSAAPPVEELPGQPPAPPQLPGQAPLPAAAAVHADRPAHGTTAQRDLDADAPELAPTEEDPVGDEDTLL